MIELSLWGVLGLVWGGFVVGMVATGLCAAARDDADLWRELEAETRETGRTPGHGPHG